MTRSATRRSASPHPASTLPGADALDRIDDAIDRILAVTDHLPTAAPRSAQEGNRGTR